MDRALRELMRSLGQGRPGPKGIKLLVGSMVIYGRPCSEAEFTESYASSERELATAGLGRRERRDPATADRLEQEIRERASGPLAALRDGSEPDALCLLDASAGLATGETLYVPALRVSFDQITGWWGGPPQFQKAAGGGWFIGGIFPAGE